jgi:pyruvate/2-oxoacid:ferredoxin oxidoreductase alpha subunit
VIKPAAGLRKVMVGNHAVSLGVKLARCEVISAYPITPQTQIVEMLSEMCASGELPARFIRVESEHSAMAACVGASAAGARTFTASSSHGLAYMHEMLHWAAGGRLPVVLANVNRAMGPGWNIWMDQGDSLAQRDTGWVQLYCESNQEVLDTAIHAFRLAETVDLPVMVVLDAFYLSHTSEPVEVPTQHIVDAFLPPRAPRHRLDTAEPHAYGALVRPEDYTEMRRDQQDAMERVHGELDHINADWSAATGRSWPAVEGYRLDDAELVLVTSGTITSTARTVIDARRSVGQPIGLAKVRLFRPFPTAQLRALLRGCGRIAVLDRNVSPGHGGIFAEELRSALYDLPADERPTVFGYVLGLGGRDVTPSVIDDVINQTDAASAPEREDLWVGVKS